MSTYEREADLSLYPGPVWCWLVRLLSAIAVGWALWRRMIG